MSSRTIYGSDIQFNRIHFNDAPYGKYFNRSIILNELEQLNFNDGTQQTTAYLGNSPTPTDYTYTILSTTNLICNTGTANLEDNLIIFNSNTGYQGSLYFNDASNNPITSFNITFSNTFTSSLTITFLSNMTIKPSYTTSQFCYIVNNNLGSLTYGTIILLSNGNLTVNFNNIEISSLYTYTLNITSFKFN